MFEIYIRLTDCLPHCFCDDEITALHDQTLKQAAIHRLHSAQFQWNNVRCYRLPINKIDISSA